MNTDPVESFSGGKPAASPKETSRKPVATATVRVLRAGSEDIVVGENSSLEGSFETQGSMFVDGMMSRADLKTALLSIGVAGSVEGNANADRAEIAGTFDGRLVVTGEVILRSSSHVTGEIQCGKLISHRGATIKAQVTVIEDDVDLSDMEGASPHRLLPIRKGATRSFLRRSATFGYGVFFTLGAIGLLSLVAH
ncbi:polymer-forming cytoskeletal protein [Parvibaculum sp.]|uniref:bactofilin family protein n=1 Tax=Parvibaculum sp. TaxID=2024848 RepID=UPI002C256E04|nr:polymer-forming cytoskeletal protein [Parvibaculum sp.]HUD53528.1 polymer-forming cytoskeletal protein [Parvibaculum sp.]